MPNWSREAWMIATSIVLAITTVVVAVRRNVLAAAILQAVTLIFSIVVAWLFGRVAARDVAQYLTRVTSAAPVSTRTQPLRGAGAPGRRVDEESSTQQS